MNTINRHSVPPNPRWLSCHGFFCFLLCAYIMHGFQVPHNARPTRPILIFTSHFLLSPQCVNSSAKSTFCCFLYTTLFSNYLINRHEFILFHAYPTPIRYLLLPFSFDSITFCIIATGLLTRSSILLLFSLPPKNSPTNFCRLGCFLCSSLIPLLSSCDFAVIDMMETCDKACTSVGLLGSVL